MSSIIEPSPILDIYPKEWSNIMKPDQTAVYQYRNLQHFKHHVKLLTQKEDRKCNISYADALDALLKDKATMSEGDYQIIKNKVRENLLKRGLISETVYESYHYDVEGELWDVAKVIAEDPACCLVPTEKYTSYFYELYISVSYPYNVSDSTIMENMAKILATVELLEQEHIYCKITLVMPNTGCNRGPGKRNYFGLIPVFSHRDTKSIATMSAILNDRLLRKFFFAIWEDLYKDKLESGYGMATQLPKALVPVNLNEVDFAQSILDTVIVGGNR